MARARACKHSKERWEERVGNSGDRSTADAISDAIPQWVMDFAGNGECKYTNDDGVVFIIRNRVVVTVWSARAANDS